MCEALNLSTDIEEVTHGRNTFDASTQFASVEIVVQNLKNNV